MASRRRIRPRRLLMALLLLALLFLLLAIGRFFPGALPGSGGPSPFQPPDPSADPRGGSRAVPDLPEEGSEAPEIEVGPGEVLVLVRLNGGEPCPDCEVGPAGGTSGVEPVTAKGEAALDREEVLAHGLLIRHAGGEVRVAPPQAPLPGRGALAVVLPKSMPPSPGPASPLELVLDAESGALPEAIDLPGARRADVGSDGRVDLGVLTRPTPLPEALAEQSPRHDLAPLRAGERPRRVDPGPRTLSPHEGSPLTLPYEARVPVRAPGLAYVLHADGTATLPDRDGAVRIKASEGPGAHAVLTRGPGAIVAVPLSRESVEAGTPPEARPEATDAARFHTLFVLGADGRPVPDETTTLYVPLPRGTARAERIEVRQSVDTSAEGALALYAPLEGETRVLIQSPRNAPHVARVGPGGPADTEVRLKPARFVPVKVAGPDGAPLVGAWVRAYTSLSGVPVHVPAAGVLQTDGQGEASLGPLPAERVEIYAGADGHVIALQEVDLSAGTAPVHFTLARAARLEVRVEDHLGRPVRTAEVSVLPEDSGVRLVEPRWTPSGPLPDPGAGDAPRSASFTFDALPVTRYMIDVQAPGYRAVRVRGVRPGDTTWYITLIPR